MLTIVRRSQIQGLIALDSSTISHLGVVDEVWLDETGRVSYLSGRTGYLPLDQVADIGHQALSTYGQLVITPPAQLQSLDQLAVHSPQGEPVGWVDDFLFDWHTGKIVAYLLAGQIADPLGEYAVLFPDDVEAIEEDYLTIRDGTQSRLQPQSEGLKGFLSEKPHPVRHLVKVMSDRLHHLVSPHDHPEVVRVKVKELSDEMAASGEHDPSALQDATHYLHEQWESLQHSISRSGRRATAALESAWRHLMGQP